ncbi:MAG: hypothetical protein KDK36_07955, partial [Leptospiraceae bacterium]|nr:hypothetical protein [Leptospiraceae bacterium]
MKIWKKLSLLILFLFFFNCGNTFNQLSGEKEDDGETENLLLLGALLSSSGCNGLWTVNVFTGDYTCTGAYLASSGT